MTKKILAIVGPTGSGKTDLAIKIAQKSGGVVISADSRQVYRRLDIGSNKEGVSASWNGQPSRLINDVHQLMVDVVDPGESWSLGLYLKSTRPLILELWRRGLPAIVVGGTGLYVSAILDQYRFGQAEPSIPLLPEFESCLLELSLSRAELYSRAEQRIEKIWPSLLDEVLRLRESGVSDDWLLRIGLDYRLATEFLLGILDEPTAKAEYLRITKAYIRRQQTWWRHHGRPIICQHPDRAEELALAFLNNDKV